MNKMIPAYQLALTFFSLLIVMITAWVNVNSRITALEIQQQENNTFKVEMRTYFKELSSGQTSILVELQNKKNRE
jgi:hypothetical protein